MMLHNKKIVMSLLGKEHNYERFCIKRMACMMTWRIISIAANNPNVAKNLRNTFPNPYSIDDAKWYVNDCISNEGKNRLPELLLLTEKLLEVLEYLSKMMCTKNRENLDIGFQKIIGVKGLHLLLYSKYVKKPFLLLILFAYLQSLSIVI